MTKEKLYDLAKMVVESEHPYLNSFEVSQMAMDMISEAYRPKQASPQELAKVKIACKFLYKVPEIAEKLEDAKLRIGASSVFDPTRANPEQLKAIGSQDSRFAKLVDKLFQQNYSKLVK